jgi:hypothetical protein
VTHHFPSHQSCHPDFHDDKLTPCYGNRFDASFTTQTALWIHGHTHRSVNYRIGDSAKQCRVVANPRGFPFWDGLLPGEWENKEFRDDLLVVPDTKGLWGVIG